MATTTVLGDLPARIKAAAVEVRDTKDAYELALQQRDRLIVEGVDGGMTQLEVARLAEVVRGRVSAILAGSQADDE